MIGLLFYGVWLAAFLTVILVVIGLLPPGNAYPFPQEIEQGILGIVHYAQTLNMILPLDTLLAILKVAVILFIVTRIVFPLVGKITSVLFKIKPGNS